MRRELILIVLAGCLFFVAALTDAYNTEQYPANEDGDGADASASMGAASRVAETLVDRLGYAILINAGYADVSMPADEQQRAEGFNITPHLDNPELLCASPFFIASAATSPDATSKINSQFLLMSILAAEKYNRSAVMRWIEGAWARTVFSLTGELPDLSLGIAQIRPSTIRHALVQNAAAIPPSAGELLDYALDDCSNVFAASVHLQTLLQSVDVDMTQDQIVAAVARLYSGGDNATYVSAVSGAYQILNGGGELPVPNGQTGDGPVKDFDICVWFDLGMPGGKIAWEDYAAEAQPVIHRTLAMTTEIRVALVDRQPGPRSYLVRLDDQRRQWLGDTLQGLGAGRQAILFETTQNLDGGCFLNDTTAASARLRVALPAGFQPPAQAKPEPPVPDPSAAPLPSTAPLGGNNGPDQQPGGALP